MSPLRQRLKRPETYLVVFAVLVLALAVDAMRRPQDQLSARAYVELVGLYQCSVSSSLSAYITCRFEPTCSRYSRDAVERHGLLRGISLSVERFWSCRRTVPLGSSDPVPEQ